MWPGQTHPRNRNCEDEFLRRALSVSARLADDVIRLAAPTARHCASFWIRRATLVDAHRTGFLQSTL